MISWLVCVVKLLSSALPALRFHSPLSCFNHITIQALCREEWTRGNQETWGPAEEAAGFGGGVFAGWCKQTQLVHSVDSEAVSIYSAFFLSPPVISISHSLFLHLPVTQFCRTAAHIITCPTEILLWHFPECTQGKLAHTATWIYIHSYLLLERLTINRRPGQRHMQQVSACTTDW